MIVYEGSSDDKTVKYLMTVKLKNISLQLIQIFVPVYPDINFAREESLRYSERVEESSSDVE